MNLIKGFDRSERIVAMFSVKEFTEDLFIQFYTSKGQVKKTSLTEYNTRRSKIQACGLNKEIYVLGLN